MDSGKQTEFFYEIFDASLPRLGAGNETATIQALNNPACGPAATRGTGRATHDQDPGPRLRHRRSNRYVGPAHAGVDSGGRITMKPYLAELQRHEAAGVSGKI